MTPTSGGLPYTVECNDVIEALNLSFAEGNILKALWRIAAERKGEGKPGNPPMYDAEKVKFFGDRVLAQAKVIPTTSPSKEPRFMWDDERKCCVPCDDDNEGDETGEETCGI